MAAPRRRWFPPNGSECHCGRVIAGARIMAGLTQAGLGEAAGLSARTIRHWEASAAPPSHYRTMTKLAKGLKVHGVAFGFNPVPYAKQVGIDGRNLHKDRRDGWQRYVAMVLKD